MPGTLRDHQDKKQEATVRLLCRALYFDKLLDPPLPPWVWSGDKLVVGRGEKNALAGDKLTLHDGRVSTQHAVLELRDGGPWVEDAGSSNGTFLNGEKLEGPAMLEPGDLIEVGRSVLVYREVKASLAPALVGGGVGLGSLRSFTPSFAEVLQLAARAAPTKEPVLLVGETGSGKDVLARELHAASGRKGPFVAVDAGAIPDTLFESTLFGHEKGAFTGATEARTGELVKANKGTLFLDEVGNLSASSQARLLRVLETGEVTPLGASRSVSVDVRIVAATNRSVLEGDDGFREDLLHRLAGFVLSPPPLRERRDDLGLLVRALLAEAGVEKASITPGAARELYTHRLSGNVRQLRNVLRRAAVGHKEIAIEKLDGLHGVPAAAAHGEPKVEKRPAGPSRPRGWKPTRDEMAALLDRNGGSVAAAARELGSYPRQLYRWLDELGMTADDFRK